MAFILIGGSRSQLGLLEQARALGHEVCVVDGAETAPLLAEADVGIVQDFSDVEGVLNALRERGVEPEAVATMGSDQAVLPTAHFAERLGLPGLPVQTAEIVADKRLMRAAFEAAEVPAPRGPLATTRAAGAGRPRARPRAASRVLGVAPPRSAATRGPAAAPRSRSAPRRHP